MYGDESDASRLDVRQRALESAFSALYAVASLQPDTRLDHFGFRDGVSQPHLRNDNVAQEITGVLRAGPEANAVNAGEFLLGYLDEFGCYQPSPLLPPTEDPDRHLVRGEDGLPDFGRNGTYLVMRQLEQDVRSFHGYVTEASQALARSADWVAAKMIGRWPSGAPLTLHPHHDPGPDAGAENDFGYASADRAGQRCPIGAHIRRSNPRDSGENQAPRVVVYREAFDRPTRVANRHRLIRRGRPYGESSTPGEPEPNPDRAISKKSAAECGLVFVALMASIRRQFEFVQTSWCNNPSFQGLIDEPDPLIGGGISVVKGAGFTIQGEVPRRLRDVARFITVKGGAYFFLPSLRALRYLATRTT
jgi:Dyp-type peroxidase family